MTARRRRVLVRLAACLMISLLLAGLTAVLGSAGRLGRFEGIASDLAFPRGSVDPSLATVAIDAKALAEVDPAWPWPRQRHAELVRVLDDAGAQLIVFDIAFVSPADGDEDLAAAIGEAGNVVLATTSVSTVDDTGPSGAGPLRATVLAPVPVLADQALAIAHSQVVRDPTDGVVRAIPLVVEDDQRRVLPALSLAAMGLSTAGSADPILRRPSGVQVADRAVPTNDSYEMRVSYPPELTGPSSPEGPVVSAADVLSGETPAEVLRDKVVFVGVTDVSLGDRLLTPVAKGSGLPGVLVHASAYDTIASRAYLDEASTLEMAAWVFGIALVIALAVQFLPASLAGIVALATLVAYLVLAFVRVDTGVIMGFALPTLAVALAVPLSGGVRYLMEIRQQRRVSALFSQYVPDRVAAQLIDEGSVERVAEGQRLDVTAMFCDLRGFTSRSADLLPIEVNTMLNDFYEFSCAIVLNHGGTLMTYIGDEIFVIFGAPMPQPDHAQHAVACAKELQERCAELDDRLATHGFESLRFGIGLNSGEIVATHAGSTWRRQYTAIGTAVNVAARLTAQSGPGQVVLSDAVRSQIVPPPMVEPLGQRDMKGVPDDFVAWKLVLDVTPSGAGDR